MKSMRTLFREFAAGHTSLENPDHSQQRVFGLVKASEIEDPLSRRIILLADGKSMAEITAIIYGEELRRGGWLADIGLWKRMFQQELCRKIFDLAGQGCIALEHDVNDSSVGVKE